MKTRLYAKKELKKSREAKGFTQQQAAELFSLKFGRDISRNVWAKWESGERNIEPEDVLALGILFNKKDSRELIERRSV